MTEWVEFGRTFREFNELFVGKTTVGYEIETAAAVYLIGDINELGGVCDDCCDVDGGTIVIRYRQVYDRT